jgi:hypothetical protein
MIGKGGAWVIEEQRTDGGCSDVSTDVCMYVFMCVCI